MTAPQSTGTEAKRSWFARHKILTALLAIVVLAIAFSALNGGASESASEDSNPAASDSGAADAPESDAPKSDVEAAPESAPDTAGFGTPVRDGKFEFVVLSAQPGVPSVGEDFLTETAQGEYVLVTMSVRNIGEEAQSFTTSAQKLLDGQSRQFSVDDMATIVLDEGVAFEQINPGNSIEVTVVFDVPAGTVPAEIELHDSMFSGGTTVSLQ